MTDLDYLLKILVLRNVDHSVSFGEEFGFKMVYVRPQNSKSYQIGLYFRPDGSFSSIDISIRIL